MTLTHHEDRSAEVGVFALPGHAYTSHSSLEREIDRLFKPGWTFAGMRSSAYEPGPYNPDQEPVLREFYDWYRERMNPDEEDR